MTFYRRIPVRKGMFMIELEDFEDSVDDADIDELPREPSSQRSVRGKIAEKLDSLMVLTFEHLKSCDTGGRLIEVFETLVQSFQITVLNAYKSKLSQFVILPVRWTLKIVVSDLLQCLQLFLLAIFIQQLPEDECCCLSCQLLFSRKISVIFFGCVSMLKRLVAWYSEYCHFQDGEINPEAHRVFILDVRQSCTYFAFG